MYKYLIYLVFPYGLICLLSGNICAQEQNSAVIKISKPDSSDVERRGPANKPFQINNLIESDVDFTGDNILNIKNTVYRDDNIKSGHYYYLPGFYALSWSDAKGNYDFQFTYSGNTGDGGGKATVTAILRPRLSKGDLAMAREILLKNLKGKPEQAYGIQEFMTVPLAKPIEVDFTNLSQFGITDKDLSIRAPSELTDPIYMSFTTTRIEELMQMFFNNVGLYGNIVVTPDGEGMPAVTIPFNLKIDAPETYGKIDLLPATWRSKGWQNKTLYPFKLNNFNVLKRESDGAYKVYTWKTGEVEVAPGAKVEFEGMEVPGWIDNSPNVKKIWMDFTVQTCSACNKAAKKKIIGSTDDKQAPKAEKIEFTFLNPIQFTKVSLIKVKVRSYQATPEGNSNAEVKTFTVKEDNSTEDGGTIYVRGDKVDFEYQIQAIMGDGTPYTSAWIRSNSRDVIIGKKQIKDSIEYFKNKN